MTDAVYAPDRLSMLTNIVPQFCSHCQSGDHVLMGLGGDDCNPYSPDDRPSAQVVDVRHETDGVAVQLRNDATGETFWTSSQEVDPSLLFEFEPRTFENVLMRSMDAPMQMDAMSDTSDVQLVPHAVHDEAGAPALSDVARELRETRSFAENMVSVVYEMNREIKSMGNTLQSLGAQLDLQVKPKTDFSKTYVAEYRAMNPEAGDDSSSSASSVASYESELSDYASSDEGEDFVNQLF